ncbi:hypothetical protein GEV01_18580 [Rugamonas sp. FT103W]|uniref:Glycine zipper domain-containing protein n=1 Tax=Rugamonas rivuli TaxID=2743358 RepID=A0A843SHA3_9BURK|nr:hypothetical protein [Rugamonas rivuli]
MTNHCPNCGSERVDTKGYARRVFCGVGTIAGAIFCARGAAAGAELGVLGGMFIGPPGAAIGGVTGTIVGALVGAAAGGSAGASLGEIIDEKILDNLVCLNCGFSFSPADSEDRQQSA